MRHHLRVVQHRSQVPLQITDRKPSTLYETLIFTTFTERRADGTVADRRNAIVQINWRIKSKQEILADKSALMLNPLGVEVLTLELKEDPTPAPADDKVDNPGG